MTGLVDADFLKAMADERRTEHLRKLKWARDAVRRFEGLSLEAVLVGVFHYAFIRWDEVTRSARLFQLDIEQHECEERRKVLNRKAREALAAVQSASDLIERDKAWRRYERVSAQSDAEYAREEGFWKQREKLWKE